MAAKLNHTIVAATDPAASAAFLADVFGLPEPTRYGPFHVVSTGNDVSLDFLRAAGPVHQQHYAFLVSEDEFDAILARVRERGLDWWADPGHTAPNTWNTNDGGRAFYFSDPDGHNLEALTRPYGSGGWTP